MGVTLMEFAMVLLTLVLIVVTSVYVYLTYRLMREAEATRKADLQSEMIVDVDREEGSYYLSIRNLGKNPAWDVQINIDPPLMLQTITSDEPVHIMNFSGFGVGQRRTYFIAGTAEFWSKDAPREHKIGCEWNCPISGKREYNHMIDMNSYYGNSEPTRRGPRPYNL
jgi:hypothetical protein